MVKLDVISGFLGAGKTTLLLQLMRENATRGEKIAIVENEFGKVSIDGDMLKKEGLSVLEVTNGCVCCTLKGELIGGMAELIDTVQPDRIVLEPSGIFMLTELSSIMKDEMLKDKLTLGAVIVVIDAQNFIKLYRHYDQFFKNQIACATRVVLSKTQFAKDKIEEIVKEIKAIRGDVPIVTEAWENLHDAWSLFEVEGETSFDVAINEPYEEMHGFQTVGFPLKGKVIPARLQKLLNRVKVGEFGEIVRCKGFAHTGDGGVTFQLVGEHFSIRPVEGDLKELGIEAQVSVIGKSVLKKRLEEEFEKQ